MSVLGLTLGAMYANAEPASDRPSDLTAPFTGIVRAAGKPVAGAILWIRGTSDTAVGAAREIRTGPDGLFVIGDARAGLYTVVTAIPGFRPVIRKVLHRPDTEAVSFVAIDLERAEALLPHPAVDDPWSARAVVGGDLLREGENVLPPTVVAVAGGLGAEPILPGVAPVGAGFRASVTSMAGFGDGDAADVARASVDLGGNLGRAGRWGLEGEFNRFTPRTGESADATRLALDVAPGGDQNIRVSTERRVLPGAPASDAAWTSHALAWTGAMGRLSEGSVSARYVSLVDTTGAGPVPELFGKPASALELSARFRQGDPTGAFLRVTAGYRADLDSPTASAPAFAGREARLGALVGARAFGIVLVEGGATGDVSWRARGVTPEVSVSVLLPDGWTLSGFGSRRLEKRLYEEIDAGWTGSDVAELTRLSRNVIRASAAWSSSADQTFAFAYTHREIDGLLRLVLSPHLSDQFDTLYFLPGDEVGEISSEATFRVTRSLAARMAARAGTMSGEREGGVITSDDARYAVVEASVRFAPTSTTVGATMRRVDQALRRGTTELRNDRRAFELAVSQSLPIPILRGAGSDWKALLSMEWGRSREGQEAERSNRRVATGLGLSF